MICQSCGADVREGQKFCGICGAKSICETQETPQPIPVENEQLSGNYMPEEIPSDTEVGSQDSLNLEEALENNVPPAQYTAQAVQTPEYNEGATQQSVTESVPKPKKKKGKVKAAFLSVFVSLFVIIFTFLTLGVLTFRASISKENISSFISNINVDEVIESDQFAEIEKEWKGRFTKQELKRIYKKSGAEDYLKSVAVEYSEYILGGEVPSGITSEDVVDLVRENAKLIEKETGYKIKKSDYTDIENYMNEHEEAMGVFAPGEAAGVAVKAVSVLTSVYMLVILGIILLLLLLWMFKVRYWSSSALSWFAYASIMGIVAFVVLVATWPITLSAIGIDIPLVHSSLKLYVGNSIWCVIINSAMLLSVNIIFILLHTLIRAFKKRA